MNELSRFHEAQTTMYAQALKEIENEKKQSHWMWFIFPQLRGLGRSVDADYYGISDISEAQDYLQDKVLGKRLEEISNALLACTENDIAKIFGRTDAMKLKSSMTLFSIAKSSNPVFKKVLTKFFNGETCPLTTKLV
jgi:uncharacterized protein (DUF1810 family)